MASLQGSPSKSSPLQRFVDAKEHASQLFATLKATLFHLSKDLHPWSFVKDGVVGQREVENEKKLTIDTMSRADAMWNTVKRDKMKVCVCVVCVCVCVCDSKPGEERD